jgi:hypothetical protein
MAAAAVLLSTVAAHSDDAKNACGEAAIADFRARLMLIQQESPVLPVEATIAVRRLEEEFCLRFVRCAHSDPNSFRFRASFEWKTMKPRSAKNDRPDSVRGALYFRKVALILIGAEIAKAGRWR